MEVIGYAVLQKFRLLTYSVCGSFDIDFTGKDQFGMLISRLNSQWLILLITF